MNLPKNIMSLALWIESKWNKSVAVEYYNQETNQNEKLLIEKSDIRCLLGGSTAIFYALDVYSWVNLRDYDFCIDSANMRIRRAINDNRVKIGEEIFGGIGYQDSIKKRVNNSPGYNYFHIRLYESGTNRPCDIITGSIIYHSNFKILIHPNANDNKIIWDPENSEHEEDYKRFEQTGEMLTYHLAQHILSAKSKPLDKDNISFNLLYHIFKSYLIIMKMAEVCPEFKLRPLFKLHFNDQTSEILCDLFSSGEDSVYQLRKSLVNWLISGNQFSALEVDQVFFLAAKNRIKYHRIESSSDELHPESVQSSELTTENVVDNISDEAESSKNEKSEIDNQTVISNAAKPKIKKKKSIEYYSKKIIKTEFMARKFELLNKPKNEDTDKINQFIMLSFSGMRKKFPNLSYDLYFDYFFSFIEDLDELIKNGAVLDPDSKIHELRKNIDTTRWKNIIFQHTTYILSLQLDDKLSIQDYVVKIINNFKNTTIFSVSDLEKSDLIFLYKSMFDFVYRVLKSSHIVSSDFLKNVLYAIDSKIILNELDKYIKNKIIVLLIGFNKFPAHKIVCQMIASRLFDISLKNFSENNSSQIFDKLFCIERFIESDEVAKIAQITKPMQNAISGYFSLIHKIFRGMLEKSDDIKQFDISDNRVNILFKDNKPKITEIFEFQNKNGVMIDLNDLIIPMMDFFCDRTPVEKKIIATCLYWRYYYGIDSHAAFKQCMSDWLGQYTGQMPMWQRVCAKSDVHFIAALKIYLQHDSLKMLSIPERIDILFYHAENIKPKNNQIDTYTEIKQLIAKSLFSPDVVEPIDCVKVSNQIIAELKNSCADDEDTAISILIYFAAKSLRDENHYSPFAAKLLSYFSEKQQKTANHTPASTTVATFAK